MDRQDMVKNEGIQLLVGYGLLFSIFKKKNCFESILPE